MKKSLPLSPRIQKIQSLVVESHLLARARAGVDLHPRLGREAAAVAAASAERAAAAPAVAAASSAAGEAAAAAAAAEASYFVLF